MIVDEGAGSLETAAGRVPASGTREAGGRGYPEPAAVPGTAQLVLERREAASAAADQSPEDVLVGEGVPGTCGSEGWGARPEASGKAEEVTTEERAIFMEEAGVDMGKQQVGEETGVAEKLVREKKLEVGAEAQEDLGPVNFGGPDVDSVEAIRWELEAVNAQADRAYLRLERRFGRMRRFHLAEGASSSRIFLAVGLPPS